MTARKPASAHRGGAHRGSIRNILRRVESMGLPHDFRPFNNSWRFKRDQHESQTRRFSAELRMLVDELDCWLDKKEEL